MYGLVNKAIKELISTQFGEEQWTVIKAKAGVDIVEFVSMQPYPDSISYDLVGAASEVLGTSASDLLEAFGEYWVLFTGAEGYGELMNMSGDTLFEFLGNLNNLHTRVSLTMEGLSPPSFDCVDVTETSMDLHYRSVRAGLAPMVVGLLRGLAKKFKCELSIEHKESKADGADHDVFALRLG